MSFFDVSKKRLSWQRLRLTVAGRKRNMGTVEPYQYSCGCQYSPLVMLSTRSISLSIVDLTSEEMNHSVERKNGSNSAKETTPSSAIPKQQIHHGTYKAGPLLQNVSVKDFCDPFGPYQIQDRISAVVKQWAKVVPQSPPSFLAKLLPSRGYQYKTIQAMQSRFKM